MSQHMFSWINEENNINMKTLNIATYLLLYTLVLKIEQVNFTTGLTNAGSEQIKQTLARRRVLRSLFEPQR